MAETAYGSLPFDEQIRFFRDKLNLPTQAWTDLWEGMHARAFVVAGAMQEDLLTDLRAAVDRAIADGTTLAQFRKDFDALVERRGWQYKGGRNWRTRVIYETNLRQSYATGRELQMKDPALRLRRPYGLYRHGRSEHPRPEHLAWDGTVLPLDDPWWETHTPMNGWGCKCLKLMVSEADVERMGLTVADQAPAIEWEEKTVGVKGPSPRTVKVPKGIDPGFAYNPGTAAWGRQLSQEAMDTWKAAGTGAWERLTPGDWQSHGRPERVPVDKSALSLGPVAADRAGLAKMIIDRIGGPERVFRLPGGGAINVNAETLAQHIDLTRSRYVPYLPELLEDPFEQWLTFERHKGPGLVVLRTRVLKAIATGKLEGHLLVAQARKGQLEAWTVIPVKHQYLQRQREGLLVYGRQG
jgi:hypothetical protein